MEKIVERTLLYDFYGELLTQRQREVFEDVVLGDLGYSEAAEEYGVSRQGIHDLVRRVTKLLEDYESKLHLVERFLEMHAQVERIQSIASGRKLTEQDAKEIGKICDAILNEL